MQEEQLKQEKEVSKEGRSHTMNIQQQQSQKELSSHNVASELHAQSQKSDERKIIEAEVDFLVNQFAINRNKALTILRKMDLKQAVRHMVNE